MAKDTCCFCEKEDGKEDMGKLIKFQVSVDGEADYWGGNFYSLIELGLLLSIVNNLDRFEK